MIMMIFLYLREGIISIPKCVNPNESMVNLGNLQKLDLTLSPVLPLWLDMSLDKFVVNKYSKVDSEIVDDMFKDELDIYLCCRTSGCLYG